LLQITHQQIAAELGTSREVVSRILEDFSAAGLIEISRGSIRLLDQQGLQRRQRVWWLCHWQTIVIALSLVPNSLEDKRRWREMQKNMGNLDRGIRIAAALVIAALIATGALSGVLAVILGVIAVAFLLISLIGFCPLYAPLGINTCQRKN
jgi:DNA-binding Lrp family transcriptional regulator